MGQFSPAFWVNYTPAITEQSQHASTLSKYVGLHDYRTINKQELSEAVTYVKRLTPAICANFVKFFPMSYAHEPPKELAINFSPDYFSGALPKILMDWLLQRTQVRSMENVDGRWRILDKLYLTRGIFVDFKNHNSGTGEWYVLSDFEVTNADEKTRLMEFSASREGSPNKELFSAWVKQSKNRAAKGMFDRIMTELLYTSSMGNTYFTRSPFVAELIDFISITAKELKPDVASLCLKLELPTIQNASLDKIMQVRLNYGEAFQNFRVELEKHLRELRYIEDNELREKKLQNIAHELEEVQINDIKNKLAHLKKSVLTEASIWGAVLCSSQYFGLASLLASLFGIGWTGMRAYNDKRGVINTNPAYFLWKLKEK